MTKEQFKTRWRLNSKGGGITFDEVADCAVKWGIAARPRAKPMEQILYLVLKAAGTVDAEEYNPANEDEE